MDKHQAEKTAANGSSRNGTQTPVPPPHPLDRYSVVPETGAGDNGDSPFYKSQAPSISLPKGGGALKGIDEKFTVNAVNGTAALEIPLPLTPGRNGFTPALSLQYNSGGGNSAFGLGWDISLPSIQRRTDRQLPQYRDSEESDVFILAGAEDLIPEQEEVNGKWVVKRILVSDTEGSYILTRYKPRIEGLFARIEHIKKQDGSASWWRVTTKDNITTYYGLTALGRIADPANAARIFRWLPDIVCDDKGNVQRYRYQAEHMYGIPTATHETNRLNGNAPVCNTYLIGVQYCNAAPWFVDETRVYNPVLPESMNAFLMAARFHYDDALPAFPDWDNVGVVGSACRKDAFSDYRAGFEIRTYRKCRRVYIFHNFNEIRLGGKPRLVRSLDISYYHDATPDVYTEADYITAVTQTGYTLRGTYDPFGTNEYATRSLPAMTFDYEPLQWHTALKTVSKADAANAPQGLTGPYQWTDFYGEGISGILTEQATGWYYKRNLGDAHFTPAMKIAQKPSFTGMGSGALQWQDLQADGSRQVVSSAPVKGYWELHPAAEPGGSFGTEQHDRQKWAPFRPFLKNINIDWDSPFTLSLDLDGDGRSDALIADDRVWTWYQNEGRKGYDRGGQARVFTDEEKGPRLILNDEIQRIFLADMSGDGLTDLVRIRNGEVCYWPNKGYGKFGAKVTMSNTPRFDRTDQYNPLYLTLADISGTGASDLIYIGKGKCTAWINLAGNGWSEGADISYLPSTDAYSKIAVTDFLGNGTGCIVWSSPLPHHAQAPLRYIDLMGGKKPYLMKAYHNGMGKTTELAYKSSTQYYLEDRREGLHWATKLPFPVHCVAQVKTADAVSQTEYVQTYRYHHGYYDHPEREFRGFGRVDTVDIETADTGAGELDQPPVLTKTWYHTGAWRREHMLLAYFKEEYFNIPDWDDETEIISFPDGLNPQELREAHRALKGLPLRQEVYAQDGDAELEDKPYTVTAFAYRVDQKQPLHTNRYASFYTYQEQSIAFHTERNEADPRVLHELTLAVDEYGNIQEQAQVVYPRKSIPGTLPQEVKDAQGLMHISYTDTVYTNDAIAVPSIADDPAGYRLRLPWETRSYELHLASPGTTTLWKPGDLKTDAAAADIVDYTVTPDVGEKRLLSVTRICYRENDGQTPLAFGVLQSRGIEHERYQLAFTEAIRELAYCDRDEHDVLIDTDRVTDAILTDAGYVDPDNAGRWWLPSGTADYENAGTPKDVFFTPDLYTDPWGNPTRVAWWGSYYLLPQEVMDAKENITTITSYDWRHLQPVSVTDPNGNITETLFDTLGMPIAQALKGKGGEGDTLEGIDPDDWMDAYYQYMFLYYDPEYYASELLQGATWRCVYDLSGYDYSGMAVSVGMIGRERHDADDPASPLQLRMTYTDGLGRVLMHKAACEETEDYKVWIGNGRTVYNNKGKAVMQYEPYFSDTHYCDTSEQAALDGVSAKLHYDPLGRVQRTDYPDGTFETTEWTPWQQTFYDRNDNTADSDWYETIQELPVTGIPPEEIADNLAWKDAASKAGAHNNTPTVQHLDTLARPFYTVQYLEDMDTEDPPGPETIGSYVTLDMQGNRLKVTDGRDKDTLTYRYNMLQSVCYQLSLDSGEQRILVDVSGQPLCGWDADDRNTRFSYDELRRPLRKELWLYDALAEEWTLTQTLEEMVYGEEQPDDIDHNLRGKLYQSKDGAGVVTIPDYDFKGNPLSSVRQFTADPTTHPDWTGSVPLEEDDNSDPILYTTSTTYDALNRPVTLTTPEGGETAYTYNKTGLLYSVAVDDVHGLSGDMVTGIEYDAKGQRLKIQYGNGTTTTYAYDPNTFRVTRIRTTRYSDNAELQDLRYWYDPVGNITIQRDFAQPEVYFDNTVVSADNEYTYDALYRLIEAEGRELIGLDDPPAGWNDSARSGKTQMPFVNTVPPPSDLNALRRYKDEYSYDQVGNMLEIYHNVGGSGNRKRTFVIATASNRLESSTAGTNTPVTETYTYDNRGNLTGGMLHLAGMSYNAENRLEVVTNIDTDIVTYYQYDSAGQRVRKTTINSDADVTEMRKYVGGWEVYHKSTSGILDIERESLHVSDDTGRIVLIETRTDAPEQTIRYQYSNHLGSATLELDEAGAVISYEEYYPYGSTSFQSGRSLAEVSLKRYRYTGKERDEESGLYYHGARYYIPWLARWCAVDPLQGEMPEWSPYNYGYCNPITWTDSTGMQPDEQQQQKYQEGERQTQAGFQKSLDEIQNSNAHPDFKKWAGDVGLSGVVSLRDQLFASKIGSYQNAPGARAMYGYDPNAEGNGVLVPESIRQRLWTEANEQAIPVLKATWAALQSGGESSGLTFQHNLNMTISNNAQGWAAITGAAIEVGLAWSAHLVGGGLSNLKQTGEMAKQSFSLSNDEVITLYRGVNSSSPAYDDALKGVVNPRGGSSGHMDAYIHNAAPEGTANSNLTSWTTDYDVALNYAYRPSREGVVLSTDVSLKRTISSPSLKDVNLIHKPGTVVNESEVLLIGKIKIEPFKIKKVRF